VTQTQAIPQGNQTSVKKREGRRDKSRPESTKAEHRKSPEKKRGRIKEGSADALLQPRTEGELRRGKDIPKKKTQQRGRRKRGAVEKRAAHPQELGSGKETAYNRGELRKNEKGGKKVLPLNNAAPHLWQRDTQIPKTILKSGNLRLSRRIPKAGRQIKKHRRRG